MSQISKRIAYLYTLRREKLNQILQKYNLNEYEYYLLVELSIKKEISFNEASQRSHIDQTITYDLIQSLNEKGLVNIHDQLISLTEKYHKVENAIGNDIKKLDDVFTKQMKYRDYMKYVKVLDELIDYYED